MCSVTISCGLIKKLWSSLCGSPKHQHSALSPLQRYDYEIQAWGRYAVSRLSIRSCHEGLWAFPPLEVAERIHTNHFLSVLDQQLVETQRERERGREREREKERERDLRPNTTEVEKHNLGWLPCCKGWSPSGNPSEPFQRNLKHLRWLRVKYYLNIWKNP